jgi:hypothetical protein
MRLVKKLLLLKERWPPSFLLSPSSLIWEMHLVACRFSNLNGLFFLTRKIPRELSNYKFPKYFLKQKVLSEVLVILVLEKNISCQIKVLKIENHHQSASRVKINLPTTFYLWILNSSSVLV